MDANATIYLKDILHLISQALLIPVMVVLVALIIYAVFSLGSLIVEFLTERRRFKVQIPEFINAINDAASSQVQDVIRSSGLLKDQKLVLLTVAENRTLPKEDLFALAKAELSREGDLYDKITGRNDMAVRLGPMIGLLGTLIPLGPGIVAMGQGDVNQLATSLLIAFDTTAAGLSAAAAFMLISRVRKRWYARYMLALETGMRCLLQKAEIEADAGGSAGFADTRRVKQAQTRALGVEYQLGKKDGTAARGVASSQTGLQTGLQASAQTGSHSVSQPADAAAPVGFSEVR